MTSGATDLKGAVEKLVRILEHECELQKQYLAVLKTERSALTSFQTEEINKCAAMRAGLNEEISSAHQLRIGLLREVSGISSRAPIPRLSEWAAQTLPETEAKKVQALGGKLKQLVTESERYLREFGSVLDFSMGVVSSTISLIWSATHNVTDTYSIHGKVHKNYTPAGRKALGVLKQA